MITGYGTLEVGGKASIPVPESMVGVEEGSSMYLRGEAARECLGYDVGEVVDMTVRVRVKEVGLENKYEGDQQVGEEPTVRLELVAVGAKRPRNFNEAAERAEQSLGDSSVPSPG